MPHYRDGREAKMFDRVRIRSGTRYPAAGGSEPLFGEAVVVGIAPAATSCELTVLVGSGAIIGTVDLPQFPGDEHPPRGGVILSGYWTSQNANECDLLDGREP